MTTDHPTPQPKAESRTRSEGHKNLDRLLIISLAKNHDAGRILADRIEEQERELAAMAQERDNLRKALAERIDNAELAGSQAFIQEYRARETELAALQASNAELVKDKERLDWLERWMMSFARLTAPDMGGLRYSGQYFNPGKELGEAGPSYKRLEGPTIRSAIDAALTANQEKKP